MDGVNNLKKFSIQDTYLMILNRKQFGAERAKTSYTGQVQKCSYTEVIKFI
jgi:hypothetical protein